MAFSLQDQALQVTGLTSTQQLVLIQLSKFANIKTFECWPSVATICKNLHKDRRTIQRAIAKLEKLGIIRRIFRSGTSNLFKIFFSKPELPLLSSECDAGGAASCPQVVAASVPPKSISINLLTNKKQAKNCVCDKASTEDQELALNEKVTAGLAMAPEKATILADITRKETVELQGFLDMYKWGNGESWRIKRAWKRLSKAEKVLVQELLPQYVNDTCWKSSGIQGKIYRCHPAKWLNERRWTEIKPKPAPKPTPKQQAKAVVVGPDPETMDRAKAFLDDHYDELKQAVYDDSPDFMAGYEYSDEMLEKLMIDKALERDVFC